MKNTKHLLAMGLILFLSVTLRGQGIEFTHGTVSEVMKQSTEQNKPIFVDCFTDWCGPCKWMAKNTFTDPDVGDFFNENFINYKLDMEKGDGPDFAQKYGVKAYPTLLFLNGDGSLLHVGVGGLPPAQFLELAEIALDPQQNLAGQMARFNDGERDPQFLSEYLVAMSKAGQDYQEAVDAWKELVKPSDLVEEHNYKVFAYIFQRTDTEYFKYVLENREMLEEKFGERMVTSKLLNNFSTKLNMAIRKNDEEEIKAAREEFMASGLPGAEKAVLRIDMTTALRSGELDKFQKLAETIAEKHCDDDWQLLNYISWTYYEQIEEKKELQKAAKWAAKSVEINRSYFNLDTHGMLLKKLGKTDEAIEKLGEAIEAAKEAGEDYAPTEQALNELKAG